MKVSKGKLVAMVVFLMAFTGSLFFNCAQPNSIASQDSNSNSNSSSLSSLSASVQPASFVIGSSTQVYPNGGTPPYSYALNPANGTVASNGMISGQTATGPVQVTITDAVGNVYNTGFSVNPVPVINPAPAPSPTPTPTTTSGSCTFNGTSYAAGQTVMAYTMAASCPCTQVALTCGSGGFTGANGATAANSFAGCSQSCRWSQSTTNSCPQGGATANPAAGAPCGAAGAIGCEAYTTYSGGASDRGSGYTVINYYTFICE